MGNAGVERVFMWRSLKQKAAIVTLITTTLAWQGVAIGQPAVEAPPPLPTTRILAIGTINPGVDLTAARKILPDEVRETVNLYLAGKIDQWFSLQGRNGVAFILNVTDTETARIMLEKLPLGEAHMMSFELTPLAPLNPLRQLQGMSAPKP